MNQPLFSIFSNLPGLTQGPSRLSKSPIIEHHSRTNPRWLITKVVDIPLRKFIYFRNCKYQYPSSSKKCRIQWHLSIVCQNFIFTGPDFFSCKRNRLLVVITSETEKYKQVWGILTNQPWPNVGYENYKNNYWQLVIFLTIYLFQWNIYFVSMSI